MTLQETYTLFERLKIDTTNTSEIKIYKKFLHILSELKIREFTKEDIAVLETELKKLNLSSNPINKTKYFKTSLHKLEKFLKDTFSLVPKGYYTNLGVSLGAAFGIIIGIALFPRWERSLGIAIGIGFGMVIGLTIGKSFDAKAKRENRVLNHSY